ncbi:MAG: hypothetical protein J6K05_00270 [Bacteroidaceae bacterium]|nr:hypothetical protein [Bacteroidaceae bacterium]MBR3757313.1 hypothetical protein [Bacteroidaceae bacterium]
MNVLFAPEVEDDLYALVRALIDKGYLGTYEFAVSYVEDLVNDVVQNIHSKLKKKAPVHFYRYGQNLRYITYQRNAHTTWYIFFETLPDCYLVTYITNNHVAGHWML